ncbi:hypothetical protein XM38_009850 [Halomicronema hongdechloris C2206]|uniref:Uncharacterized protein n=1 Tax=Halomicronema hongdechloris C2206 TaxID=1641165 RepID=A0A1Z3HIC7_9CYAN|nr:hypothetical protein [Halomicronema hongdechloris]ASC70055.1 hypothetical protein XM38_009850 [Halomicronema hongdechloris C2206]
MKYPIALSILVVLLLGLGHRSSRAQSTPEIDSKPVTAACVSDQVETLPVPFPDLPTDHWAFEAVMNLYYGCFAETSQANSPEAAPSDPAVETAPPSTEPPDELQP